MNRIYRVVWNTSMNLWVAVAETARGKGKSAATAVLNVAAASLLLPAGLAGAQAVPSATISGGAARAFVAPNGVTVVNIEAANVAGLSHNRYTQFNVNPAGLVLNNGNAAQANWQSQLAGQMAANPNLGASARLILNEVVSNNRSTLAGFTEVMGGRADVILANPYGITCSGCGFINTDRVTLTTGLPAFGPDGGLRGFSVQQGDIVVNGNGLNATAQQVLDLVARSVRIDGSISANDLGITTGTNAWDYGSRAVTGNAGALGSVPTYAIDSSALGGMYANRIRMTATEAGVGVRMLGDAAATADDFSLSAAGRIELRNRISARRDLQVASVGTVPLGITVDGTSLTAGRDLSLSSEQGSVAVGSSTLVAGQDLRVATGSSGADALTATDSSLSAARHAAVSAGPGKATLVRADLLANGDVDATGGAVALSDGSVLQAGNAIAARATSGNLDLGNAAVVAGNGMQLSSAGTVNILNGANQGVQSVKGDIAITADGGLNNAGIVSADAGTLTVRAGNAIDNSGVLNAGQALNLEAATLTNSNALQAGTTQNLTVAGTLVNSGYVGAVGAVSVQANRIANQAGGYMGSSDGAISLKAATTLDNAGVVLARAGAASLAAGGTLTNSGDLAAQQALTLQGATVHNTATGYLVSNSDAVKITSTGALINDGAVVASAGPLQLDAGGALTNNAYLTAQGAIDVRGASVANTANASMVSTGGTVTVTSVGALQNDGAIVARTGDLALNAGGALVNNADLAAGNALTANAASLQNTAGANIVSAGGPLSLSAATTLNNAGSIAANSGSVTLAAADAIGNTGAVSAGGDMVIGGLQGGQVVQVNNAATLVADGAMRWNTGNLYNGATGWIQAAQGTTAAVGYATNQGTWLLSTADGQAADTLTASASVLNQGTLQSARNLNVQGIALSNTGVMTAAGDLTGVATAGGVYNSGGASLLAGKSLNLSSTLGMVNESGGQLLGSSVTLATKNTAIGSFYSLDNRGVIAATGDALTLNVDGTVTNSGTLYGAADVTVNARDGTDTRESLHNSGALLSGGAMTMRLGSMVNEATGTVESATFSGVYASGALRNAGHWLAGTRADPEASGGNVSFDGGITNSGAFQSSGSLRLDGSSVSNQAGASMRGNRLQLNVTDRVSNDGTLQADNSLYIGADTAWNGIGAEMIASSMTLQTRVVGNEGLIQLNGRDNSSGRIVASGGFSNYATGKVRTFVADNGYSHLDIVADAVFNAAGGQLQSDAGSYLNFQVGPGGFHSQGDIDTDGTLGIASRNGNAFEAVFDGNVRAGRGFAVQGGTASSVQLADQKNMVSGGYLEIVAGNLNLGADSVLQSGERMTLNLGTLNFDKTNRIMAGMNAPLSGVASYSTINVGGALNNDTLIFSGSTLGVTAASITNGANGGIAALGSLTATASSGNFLNQGALYAGENLRLDARNGTLTNAATATAYQGTMDAGGNIEINANTLINNSTIGAPGDITVAANLIRNEVLGGDTRVTTTTLGSQVLAASGKSNGISYWDYTQLWSTQQSYNGGGTKPAQMTAGGTLHASFNQFYNLGGVLSANTVSLTGTGTNARLTNDNLSLQNRSYRSSYYILGTTYYIGSCAADNGACGANFFQRNSLAEARDGSKQQIGSTTSAGFGGGIYANTLTGTGFALVNNGGAATLPSVRAGAHGAVANPDAPGYDPLAPGQGGIAAPSGGAGLVGGAGPAVIRAPGSTGSQTRAGGAVASGNTALVRTIDSSSLSANAANGVSGTSFGGFRLTLPTNPNGYFVIAREPNARYLVETNANYQVTATTVGSDYLDRLLDYNPEQILLRLGDASYEAYLVKQQLIGQTGHDVLAGYQDAGKQMQGLMDSAAKASIDLDLTYGLALTPAQQAALKSDIVWMVATEIAGKTVLAPVVYLSPATKNSVQTGAVISAKDASLNLTALTNTGGTIVGSNNLRIASVGNITNTSGTITGGNVALGSRSGSIINQTTSTAQGTNKSSSTLIGKTAVIEATGSLVLSAKKDITNIGAVVSAGGDATLVAGRSISFDTIENKSGSATTTRSSNLFGSTTRRTTTSSVKQVGSELSTGGTLVAQAGKDITFAGTDVKVAGDAALLAGGNVGIVSRENSSVTNVRKSSSGIGVGGSVYGTQKSTQKSTSVRNDASTLDVGGDAAIVAGKDVTVRGSDVNVAGSGLIAATNVNVMAGRDVDETRTRTVTTGIGKIVGSNQAGGNTDKASTGTTTATGAEFGSSAGKGAAQVAAGASAEGGANASGGVALMSRTVRTVDTSDSRNVASNLRFGGDAQIDATGTVTLKGSNLDSAGALGINANRLDVLAGQDVKTSRVQTDTTNLGLMTSTANSGSTNANAGMSAVGQGMPGGNADAGAGVAASTDNRVSVMEQSIIDTKTRDITQVGSSITAGKGLTANVRDTITLVGSSVKSGGDMTLNAGNIVSKAAEDVHETSTTSTQFATGYYAGAGGGASAQANGSAGLGGAAGTTANAGVSAEVGAYTTTTLSKSEAATTTARVSSIESGGNLTRNARGVIVDVGTQIDVKGNLEQSADTIISMAAQDTARSSSESISFTSKTGAYAESGANAQAQARLTNTGKSTTTVVPPKAPAATPAATGGTTPAVASSTGAAAAPAGGAAGAAGAAGSPAAPAAGGADPGGTGSANTINKGNSGLGAGAMVGAGIAASFDLAQEANSASSTTARASTINVGGSMTSTSKQGTTLQATQIRAGRDVNIAAGSLDFQAAADTGKSSSASTTAGGSASYDAVNNTGTISAYGSRAEGSDQRSTAVTGAMSAGGGVNVTTTGNTRLEGTQIAAAGPVTVNAGGTLALDAARDSASATSRSGAGAVSATAGADQVSASASMSYGQSQTSRSGDRVVAIGSGQGVTLQSGGDMTMVGPQVSANGDVNVAAGGNLTIDAARNKASIDAFQVAASVSGGVGIQQVGLGSNKTYRVNQGSAAGTGGVGVQVGDRDTATAGSFGSTGGAVAFKSGGDTTMTGTQASGVGATTVTAGGAFVAKDAVSTSKGVSFGAQASAAGASEELEKKGERPKTPAAGMTPTTGTSTTPATTSPVAGASPATPWTGTQPTTGSAAKPATGPTIGGSRPTATVPPTAGTGAAAATPPAATTAPTAPPKQETEKTLTTKQLSGASGSATMNVDVDDSTKKQGVNLGAGGGGMSVVSNANSGQARLSAQAPVPGSLPRGTQVTATTSDGKPLPAWLSFDPKTGTVTGTPPAGFKGDVQVTVNVPQRDGTVKKTALVMSVK